MDFVAAALELAGLWIVGNRRRVGFLLTAAGCACWVVWVMTNQTGWGLLAVVIPAHVIALRNFWKWGEPDANA